MQQCSKHRSTATNKHTTVEELLEAVFSMRSLPRLYSEDHRVNLATYSKAVTSGATHSFLCILVVTAKFAIWPHVCAALCEKERKKQTNKQMVHLSVHQDGGRPSTWIPEILDTKLASLNSQCHAITKEYPGAGSVVQQVHKVLNDIERFLLGAHRLKWGKALSGPLLPLR
jgi:hypothetical protein